jgi:hypothetical protein
VLLDNQLVESVNLPHVGALRRTAQGQFANFQNLFVERRFCSSGRLDQFAGNTKLPSLLEKRL